MKDKKALAPIGRASPAPQSQQLPAVQRHSAPLARRLSVSPWLGPAAGDPGCLRGGHLLASSVPMVWPNPCCLGITPCRRGRSRLLSRHLPPVPAPAWACCSVLAALAKFQRLQVRPSSSRAPPPRQHSGLRAPCCMPWLGPRARPVQGQGRGCGKDTPLMVFTSPPQHRPLFLRLLQEADCYPHGGPLIMG